MASQYGNTKVIKDLINAGADVNKADNFGKTPLYTAYFNGKLEVIEVLLKAGADINKVDEEGITPLYRASINGHTAVVEALLKLVLISTKWTSLDGHRYMRHPIMVS